MTIQAQRSIAYTLTSGTLVITAPPPLAERTRRAYRELWRLWRIANRPGNSLLSGIDVLDGISVMVTPSGGAIALTIWQGKYNPQTWYGWESCVRQLAYALASGDPRWREPKPYATARDVETAWSALYADFDQERRDLAQVL
jgi:hypothetical protein